MFDMRLSAKGGHERNRLFTEQAELVAEAIDDDEAQFRGTATRCSAPNTKSCHHGYAKPSGRFRRERIPVKSPRLHRTIR